MCTTRFAASAFGVAPSKTPCTKTAGYKIKQGILGVTNLYLAGQKTADVIGADALLVVAAPFTEGGSLAVAAGATAYGVTSNLGQAISGTSQLYVAFGGNAQTGEQMGQVGEILAGPILGGVTLIGSGNVAQAQINANLESTLTAGAGLVNSPAVGGLVDFGLSLLGVSGAGCHP